MALLTLAESAGSLMKRFVEGSDRGQSMLLSQCRDEWIEESNSVRAIEDGQDDQGPRPEGPARVRQSRAAAGQAALTPARRPSASAKGKGSEELRRAFTLVKKAGGGPALSARDHGCTGLERIQ